MTFPEVPDEDLYGLFYNRHAFATEAGGIYAVGTLESLLGGGISVPVTPGYWDRSGAEPVFVREPRETVDLRPATQEEYAAYQASIRREMADQRACPWAM